MTRAAAILRPATLALCLAVPAAALSPVAPPPSPSVDPGDPGGPAPAAAAPLAAPAPLSLVADRVDIDRDARTVTASGNVEVHYRGNVLRAVRIVYREAENVIEATGPLVLTDAEGGVVLADAAALTPELTEGIVRNARLLIAGVLQVAAAEVRRTEGRYTTLFRTVASSCEICIGDPAPTWAIRADRVIADQEAQRVYFRNMTLELFGLPVAWLPWMHVADPTVERASGLLVPEFRRSQIYGAGLKVPYYHVLGPSSDATIVPFVTERGGTLVEGEYRHRFARGGVDLSGVLALNNPLDNRRTRGSFSALGDFALGQGFRADFDVNLVSDNRFLQQFDYSDADRLTSFARISRTRTQDHLSLATVGFQSLRAEERTATVPFILPEFTYRGLWHEPVAGGQVGLDLDAVGVLRDAGRRVLRLGGGTDWRREERFGPGLLAAATAGAAVDLYRVWNVPGETASYSQRLAPAASVELRWPLVRRAGAVTHLVEPIGQLVWSETYGDTDVPNEDSQLLEFDETNLFALDRFPGRDRIETGARANLGLRYSRHDPAGWRLGMTIGRVLRLEEADGPARGTGLAGRRSDWVGAVSLDLDSRLTVLNRFRVDGDLELRRNEFGLAYETGRGGVLASYIFLAADDTNPDLGPQPESSEFALDARYRFHPNWRVRGNWRYDLAADSNIRAGGGLTYGNECAEFDLSLSRRFTSSANVPPSTSIGFTIRLTGLGASASEDWPARTCRG